MTTEALRNPCLLGTTRIIQKVLDMKRKKKKKNEEKKDTIPKASGWCRLLWDFLPGNNIRPESKEIKKVIII